MTKEAMATLDKAWGLRRRCTRKPQEAESESKETKGTIRTIDIIDQCDVMLSIVPAPHQIDQLKPFYWSRKEAVNIGQVVITAEQKPRKHG